MRLNPSPCAPPRPPPPGLRRRLPLVVPYSDNATAVDYALPALLAHEATAGGHDLLAPHKPSLPRPLASAHVGTLSSVVRELMITQPRRNASAAGAPNATAAVDAGGEATAEVGAAHNDTSGLAAVQAHLSKLRRHAERTQSVVVARHAALAAALTQLQQEGPSALARQWNTASQALLAANRGAQGTADWQDTMLSSIAEVAVLSDLLADHVRE